MRRKQPATASKPEQVSLRLVQNAFVYGKFFPQGTIMHFSPADAERRLSSTQYWETV